MLIITYHLTSAYLDVVLCNLNCSLLDKVASNITGNVTLRLGGVPGESSVAEEGWGSPIWPSCSSLCCRKTGRCTGTSAKKTKKQVGMMITCLWASRLDSCFLSSTFLPLKNSPPNRMSSSFSGCAERDALNLKNRRRRATSAMLELQRRVDSSIG